MGRIEVKTSLRKRKRELKNALGDDILRYIAELVTNSDDSYSRLKDNNHEEKVIIIELQEETRNKDGYMLSVTDNAEGMTLERLEEIFGTYGENNAGGMNSTVRGIFGQGASDVLQAAAKEQRTAKIESIKNGVVSKLVYNMDEELNASINTESLNLSGNRLQQYRESISIPNNGTRVIFGIPSNVRFTKKIVDNLPELINKFYSLRYLLNQEDRKVFFIHGKEKYELSSKQYQFDESNQLSDDTFDFKFDGMNVQCRLRTYLNNNKKEDGTNIIVRDENYVVFDNTMFDFQNNAAAQNISGELIINGLYQICYNHLNSENPDAIVSDNRTGFDTKNQFYVSLNKAINPFIDSVLKENGKGIRTTNLNNNKKFSDALRKLNKYLKSELKDSISGGGNLNGKEPPAEGIKFVRNNITITKDKQYDLKLLINSDLISFDEKIMIISDSDNIEFSPSIITYNEDDIVDGLVIKNVTIKGIELTNDSVLLQAKALTRTAIAAIDVIPLDIHYPENGLEFYPRDVALIANKNHFIKLYVDSEIVSIGSKIQLECNDLETDNEIVFDDKSLLNETIGVLNVPLKGGKIGNSYNVVAKSEDKETTAKITIIEESKNDPQNGGLISGFKLEPSEMFFQSYYDPHTHFIVINNNNPINKKIMGDMSDKYVESPTFNERQSNYLCDIIANQAATLLVKQKNIKNGEVNFDDFENAVEQVQALIQQQKNKIYMEIYPAIIGKAEEKED